MMNVEHALLAARIQLDLGRYTEAGEIMPVIHRAVGKRQDLKFEADLLQMKLALRLNQYPLVWEIAGILDDKSIDKKIRVEGELLYNTALRDILDKEKLSESVVRLRNYLTESDGETSGKIYRSLARSLAKLGHAGEALDMAGAALSTANEKALIRDIGNAQLALGEALRYADSYEPAVAAYQEAITLAEGISNRDCLLWSILGLICLNLENGKLAQSATGLAKINSLLDEPGYTHPLERAHAVFLGAIATYFATNSRSSLEGCTHLYAALQINWPQHFLNNLVESGKLGHVPI